VTIATDELAQAARHDACGNHDEAINCLSRATRLGNVEAKTRLAKRLIVGDRAPLLMRQGADLMHEATLEGGAEAAALLAVLAAAGVGGAPNWAAALKLARLAAERGWQPAADQLRVLATARTGSLEPETWGSVPAGIALHDGPDVRLYTSFLNPDVCAWLIERSRSRLARARVYDVGSKADVVSETRTNSSAGFNLMETDLVHLMVQTRISTASGFPIANMEGATVLHYDIGQEIENHYDFVDPSIPNYADEVRTRGERVMTFLVYLNDGYEGGETEFPRLGVRHQGRRGEGLSFSNALSTGEPDLRSWHAGRPPRSGEKWILSQFIRNRRALQF
jgi:prolyl 4-hydroxylase